MNCIFSNSFFFFTNANFFLNNPIKFVKFIKNDIKFYYIEHEFINVINNLLKFHINIILLSERFVMIALLFLELLKKILCILNSQTVNFTFYR